MASDLPYSETKNNLLYFPYLGMNLHHFIDWKELYKAYKKIYQEALPTLHSMIYYGGTGSKHIEYCKKFFEFLNRDVEEFKVDTHNSHLINELNSSVATGAVIYFYEVIDHKDYWTKNIYIIYLNVMSGIIKFEEKEPILITEDEYKKLKDKKETNETIK